MSRFDYVRYDDKAVTQQEQIKNTFMAVEAIVELHFPGQSRAKSLLMTKLEESYMWAGKLVRDEQLARNTTTELQEGRCDS